MTRVAGVLYLQTKVAYRNWWVYVAVSLLPASYFLIFYLIGGQGLSQQVLFGSLVALSMNMGMVSLPQFLVLAKERKLQEMMVASPITPLEYMLGFALARLVFSVPGLVTLFGILLGIGSLHWSSVPLIVVIVFGSWLVGSMIGFVLATYVANLSVVGSVSNMLGFFLMLIPPVLYPVSLLPHNWRVISLLLPSSSAAYLVRYAAGLAKATPGNILLTASVLLVYLVACVLLVMTKSRWREP